MCFLRLLIASKEHYQLAPFRSCRNRAQNVPHTRLDYKIFWNYCFPDPDPVCLLKRKLKILDFLRNIDSLEVILCRESFARIPES